MEQLKLPAPLDSVEVPQYLSVTRLALSVPCLLYVVAPRTFLPPLPRGPYAELGHVVHELIDLAIAGQLGNDGIPAKVPAAFDTCWRGRRPDFHWIRRRSDLRT